MQLVSTQRIGKHNCTIIDLLLETVFPVRSMQSGYKEDNWGDPVQLRVEFCMGG
jgi:hypothetical protein